MKVTKFRAWDKVYEHFHEGDLIREYVIGDFIDNPEYIVTQCTGMKDKNDIEIYEGDIVKAWSQGLEATGEIKRRIDGLWMIYPSWGKGIQWSLSPYSDGKTDVGVIGNVYVNQNLF